MFTVFTLKNSVRVTGLVLAIVLTFPRSHTVREAKLCISQLEHRPPDPLGLVGDSAI